MYSLNWHRSFDFCKLLDARRRGRCECLLSLTLVWFDASTRADALGVNGALLPRLLSTWVIMSIHTISVSVVNLSLHNICNKFMYWIRSSLKRSWWRTVTAPCHPMTRMFESICLFVCLSVCPEHNSKTKDPKVFKVGRGNDLGISYKRYGFEIDRSKVKARVRVRFDNNTAWVRALWVWVSSSVYSITCACFARWNLLRLSVPSLFAEFNNAEMQWFTHSIKWHVKIACVWRNQSANVYIYITDLSDSNSRCVSNQLRWHWSDS